MEDFAREFKDFVQVIAQLRDPVNGCPWDLEQTHLTLRRHLLEECYETLEALDNENELDLCSELGDLLLQIVLHSQIASERGAFSIKDVIVSVREKMIRRHPHVFGTTKVDNSQEVLSNWEKIKQDEKSGSDQKSMLTSSVFEGIPITLPALLRAERIGEKSAKVNFDWKSLDGVWSKVEEELLELREEITHRKLAPNAPGNSALLSDSERILIEHELGDVLFSISQFARWLGISAENSLRSCCDRFLTRFKTMEQDLPGPITTLEDSVIEELWQKAKKTLKTS